MLKKVTASLAMLVLALLSFAALSIASIAPASASATNKQIICHATAATEQNPYVKSPEGVAKESIVKGGHGSNGINEGDIIPPFEYNFGGSDYGTYPGQNWTPENQKLWANDCNAVNTILTPVLPVPPVQTCANPNPTFAVPTQPSGINVTSAADDKGNYTVLFGLPASTVYNTYAFTKGFVNPVVISTIDNRPLDALWDAAKGACNMPDTGAGDIKSEHILYAGILISAGLVLTTMARRRNA